jgi:hypothetical protein
MRNSSDVVGAILHSLCWHVEAKIRQFMLIVLTARDWISVMLHDTAREG